MLAEIARGRPLPRNTTLSAEEAQRRTDYGTALSTLLSLLVPVRFFAGLTIILPLFLGGPPTWRFVAGTQAPFEPLALLATAALVARITRTPPIRPTRRVARTLDDHPALAALLDEVGEAIDAEPARNVRIVSGVGVHLTLGGSLWRLSRGEVDAILEIGVETLRSLDVQAFRATLVQAHAPLAADELPAATQAIAARARLCSQVLRRGRWWDPDLAWPFVRLAERIYRRASLAAARFQELRGDRLAVAICGAAPFERGLRLLTNQRPDEAVPEAKGQLESYRSVPETSADEGIAWDTGAAPYEAAPPFAERLARARNTRRRSGSADVEGEATTRALTLVTWRRELTAAFVPAGGIAGVWDCRRG